MKYCSKHVEDVFKKKKVWNLCLTSWYYLSYLYKARVNFRSLVQYTRVNYLNKHLLTINSGTHVGFHGFYDKLKDLKKIWKLKLYFIMDIRTSAKEKEKNNKGPRYPNLKLTFSSKYLAGHNALVFWKQLCRWRGRKSNSCMKSVLHHNGTICFSLLTMLTLTSKKLIRYEGYSLKPLLRLKSIPR